MLCVLQVHPWVLPQAFLQLFGGSLGSPMQEDAGVEGEALTLCVHWLVCRGGILSHFTNLSPGFPLKALRSPASRAVSLSFLPLLLESCTEESAGL